MACCFVLPINKNKFKESSILQEKGLSNFVCLEISSSLTETWNHNVKHKLWHHRPGSYMIGDSRCLARLSRKQNQSAFSISLDKIPISFPSMSLPKQLERNKATSCTERKKYAMASVKAYFACRTNSCVQNYCGNSQCLGARNSICIHERSMCGCVCVFCV